MRPLILASLMLTAPSALMAQDAPMPSENETSGGEDERGDIVVVATRMAGQVDTDIPAVMTLNEEDIATYGATSIAELLDAVSPQTGSGRGRGGGRPVILLNGQRVSSFREMRSIPPEAIRRMEVLPEEVALKFGYPPNQRVVNFILKDNFSSKQMAGEYNVPTRGGYLNWELEGGLLRIDGPRRTNLEAKIVDTSLLTEAERKIIQDSGELAAVPAGVDPGDYRSLSPENREITLNGTWSTGLGKDGLGGSLSANGAYTRSDSRSLTGLDGLLLSGDGDLRALERNVGTDTFQAGLALNKPLGDWLLTLTGDAGYIDATTRSDLPGGEMAGREIARSKDLSVSSLATVAGRPFSLPAGDASLTIKAGFDYDHSDNSDTRGLAGSTVFERSDVSAGANISLPITSRRDGVLGAVGDISLNASAGIDRLSDFGTLTDWSAGVTWKPTEKLTLQASYLVNEAAPSLSQLGAPQIVTLNVPVYDFANGETVLVNVTSGGNPDLVAEKQRDWKLSANWELPFLDRSNLLVEYFRNTSTNVTQSFPLLTPAVEAAFGDRVERDDISNRLISIDRSPVTFDRIESSRLRWGFNISGRLSKSDSEEGRGSGFTRQSAASNQPPPLAATGDRPAFDPQRWQAMRKQLCGPEGGAAPDPSTLPEEVQQRLRGPDGQLDQDRLARMRERVCSADAQQPPPGGFDPQRMERMRTMLCGDTPPDAQALPERMRQRLLGPDGNIDEARLAQLRERMCSTNAPPAAQGASDSAPREGGASGGRGMMPFGRGGPPGGRWNLSVYHTWRLSDRVVIAEGTPVLDQLAGDALAAGGIPRHEIAFEGGVFKNGFGVRLRGTWTAPATVSASGAPGTSDLRFGSTFNANARIFLNLGQRQELVDKVPLLKGTRIAFTVDNIFDSRQKVTDEAGLIPIAYQRAYREPQGRVVGIDIRKMF